MATNNGYSRKTLPELRDLHARIGAMIAEREKVDLARLRADLEAQAASHGVTLAALLAQEPAAAKRPRQATAGKPIVNPANPSQSWSGRGRKPNWLRDQHARRRHQADDTIAAVTTTA